MKHHLLIDGDILAWRFAAGEEFVCKWEHDLYTQHAFFEPARLKLDEFVDQLTEELTDGGGYTMTLSDHKDSFRKQVYPQYKFNRIGKSRPLLLRPLREHLLTEHKAVYFPRLEGDDVMGILATESRDDTPIICTIDKDLKTVPGLHFNWDKPELGIEQIDEGEAAWHFFAQVLTGDSTDGYPGCPTIGPVRAQKILDQAGDLEEVWPRIVATYKKQGLSEQDAITNARCAKILQDKDYYRPTGDILLWEPPPSAE